MNRSSLLFAVCFGYLCVGCSFAQEPPNHKGHFGMVHTAAFSPDGKKIVTASYDSTARIWDVKSGKELHTLKHNPGHSAGVYAAVFSPDGKKIVTAGSDPGRSRSEPNDGRFRIWDAETGTEVRRLKGDAGRIYSVAFSADGKKVVAANGTKTVSIWDADTGEILQTLEGHTDSVYSAAFSSDGKKIVTSSWDNTARIWDTESGQELKKLEGPTTEILAFGGQSLAAGIRPATFSPDGKKVIAATCTFDVPGDNAVLIWDAESGEVLQKLERNMMTQIKSVAFSPDGKKIVAAYRVFLDNKMMWDTLIWDAESGKELHRLKGENINSAAFSSDGKKIVTAEDNTVRIWDVGSGKELKKWTWSIHYWRN